MAIKKHTLNPEVLRKFSFFASFSMQRLEEIAETAQMVAFKANSVVFCQGDCSAAMYLILKGAVKIEREITNGETINLGRLAEYQVFGELALLSKESRKTTVTVTKDAEFLVIDREMLLSIVRKAEPVEITEFFSVLSEQIRAENDREFKETISKQTMGAQMEVEQQRLITQMVAGVAHEINTPLGIINTAVGIMARELAAPVEVTTQRAADIAESLELIRRNVERTHQLVQDFKQVSIGQLRDEKDEIDVSEVMQETLDLICVSLKRSQIRVEFQDQLTPKQKKWMGHRGSLSQILINLLTNTERYAYPNGVGGVVEVTIKMENEDCYCLTVRDFGKGIPEENQSRVFEPFFTTGRLIGGSGLGLSIVHNLVTSALNGEIKLKSNEGFGTEIMVTFPRVIL